MSVPPKKRDDARKPAEEPKDRAPASKDGAGAKDAAPRRDEPPAAPPKDDAEYGADKIQVLEGLEAVRRRPGMYIGDTTTRGLHHLVYEIVDNSVDEHLAGHARTIQVRVTADDGIVVTDDGRGIPTDEVPGQGLSGVTVAYTKLHAGGKFDHGAYKVSGGLHGVGASVVNALSERCEVEVYQRGKVHFQAFERGRALTKLEVRGRTDKRGTKVYFKPDPKIFPVTKFDAGTIATRLRELAFLNKGLEILFTDERNDPPKEERFRYEGGIKEFVTWLNEGKETLHNDVFYMDREQDGVRVEIAFQFNNGFSQVEQTFANNIHTVEGGTHLSGFRTALTRRLADYSKREKYFSPDEKPSGDHFREGLTAVISVKVPDPQFEGQTKTKLGNGEVEGIVNSAFGDALATFLEESPRAAKSICEKAVLAFRAYEAARKAKDLVRRKGALASGNLPGKLADCQNRDLESTELFIVEGESAGGTAKSGRDRTTQAILPLRGKILNVEKARLDKMLGHEEIRTLIQAIGTGIGREEPAGEGFDLSRLRYGKVIIMTDADVDGSHIRTLLLTFFFRHMLPLVEAGRVYVAQPPLFKVARKKSEEYVFEERALRAKLLKLGCESARFEPAGPKATAVQGKDFAALVEGLAKLEELARAVERRSVPLATYLAAEKDGRLPLAIWRPGKASGGGAGKAAPTELDFVRTEDGMKRRLEELKGKLGRDPVIFEEGDDPKTRDNADVALTRIYEHAEIARAAKALERFGVDPRTWTVPLGPDGKPAKALGRLVVEGADPVDVGSLRDLLVEVRKAGQRGVDVQRYKGLGEMNADQLKSTTMDPERRTLLQVRLSDVAESDRLFGLLMGESVEPRKVFIEAHALEVTNLDV
ncbi:MAG: DNA topoisomerase (ATP-hydrolyzing) subunit B [Planctomycetes bacterium]|nr:DNA topoisomerase (ATP-hydrolyzing) subunit B [Planctomycetota bacterium]